MHEGAIETTRIPRNPLDVLAQQLVAMTVMDRWSVDDLLAVAQRALPYETLTREVLEGVLGMLAGAYPSDEFAELKPRVVWDRVTDTVEGRRDARVVAVTSGGTIPDRGLFGVFMVGEAGTPGRRVGELDEEMVYELRAGMHGDVIVLGASSWRVEDIGPDRVTVSPAPGVPGKLPFWKGDAVGRPIELGRALGAFVGELEADLARGAKGRAVADARLRETHDLDELAARNLLAYLDDEREVTGALPTDKRIVVERFRDELGDWRLCILSPFGGRVHAPWSLALEARIGERLGLEVQTIWSDDGIAIRLPEGDAPLDGIEALLFPDADEVEDLVVGQLATSALFASRFRENAARALLLPRRRPGTRTPLWQQRQRSADLLAVASRYGSFPILVETYRECLSDVFDLPALREILAGVASREIAIHSVETVRASPFAGSLMFDYVAAYMYDGDTPIAERRAGRADARSRPAARAARPGGAARAARPRRAGRPRAEPPGADRRPAGDDASTASTTCCGGWATCPRPRWPPGPRAARRSRSRGSPSWPAPGARSGRGSPARSAGSPSRTSRATATASGSRRRSASRRRSSVRPSAALDGLLARCARTHGPFLTPDPARRWGLPVGVVDDALERLLGGRHAAARRVPAGRRGARVVRPGGPAAAPPALAGAAAARGRAGRSGGARPVPARVAGRGAGRVGGAARPPLRGSAALERLAEVVDQLAGLPIPASVLERDVLPARIPGYQPRLLDELGALGEVAWVGRGSLGRDDGRIVLVRPGREIAAADRRRRTAPRRRRRPTTTRSASTSPRAARRSTASCSRRRAARSDREVLDALWDLVWAGEVTNDTFAPLRALRWKRTGSGALDAAAAAGPADRARSARGGRPLVARRAGRGVCVRATERLHAQSLALLERHGVLTREAVATEGDRGRVRGRLPDPAGDGGGRPDPARLLRRRARGRPVRAGRRARSAARGPRPGRAGATGRGPPPRRGRPGQPVRRRAAVAAPRRDRPAAAPARGGRVRRARRRRRGAVPGARRVHAPDPAGGRRPGRGGHRGAVPCARWSTDGRIRELVIRKVDGEEVAASPFRPLLLDAGLRGRLPRPRPPCRPPGPGLSARGRHALPDRGGSPAVPRRADRHRGADRRARAPSRRSTASSGARSPRSSRSARTS